MKDGDNYFQTRMKINVFHHVLSTYTITCALFASNIGSTSLISKREDVSLSLIFSSLNVCLLVSDVLLGLAGICDFSVTGSSRSNVALSE